MPTELWANNTGTTSFDLDVETELKENEGKLMNLGIEIKPATGESVQVTDRFSQWDTEEITERNGTTKHSDLDVERRYIHKPNRDGGAILLDPDDEMGTDVGLRNPMVTAVADGVRRYRQRQLLRAAYGTAFTGKNGLTQVPFKPANILPADTGETPGTYTGITLLKLRAAKKKLAKNLVDLERETPIWIIDAEGADDLLGIDQYINGRYNPKMEMALQTGQITPFMGFNFVQFEFLNQKATKEIATTVGMGLNALGHQRNLIFVPSAFKGREWLTFKGKMDERSDRNHSLQVAGYSAIQFGRMHEDKVIIQEIINS